MFDVPVDIIKKEHKLIGHTSDGDGINDLRFSDLELVAAMRDSGKRWPRTMSLRQCGKKSNHGLNYDETAYGFALINEIEIGEAKPIVDMYHDIYPGIRIWYESVKRQLQKDRILTNCFGRSVRFLDAWGDKMFKSAYSMLPQSTVVDSLNQGMERIYEDDELCGSKNLNGDVLAQVHDSVLMQFPIRKLLDRDVFERVIHKISDFTSPDIHYNNRTFKIATDYKFGLNWGEHNKDKNPGGMMEFEDYDSFVLAVAEWEKLRGERTFGLA
jgi:DNA polymerase I-like protein with 3'-5' exonuclease and polymerase domains